MCFFNQLAIDNCTIVQHICQVYQTAVERWVKVMAQVVDIDKTIAVCLCQVWWQHHTQGNIFGNFFSNKVTHCGNKGGVFVGVGVENILFFTCNNTQYLVVDSISLTLVFTYCAVCFVVFGCQHITGVNQCFVYIIFNFFDCNNSFFAFKAKADFSGHSFVYDTAAVFHSFQDCLFNFCSIKFNLATCALYNCNSVHISSCLICMYNNI